MRNRFKRIPAHWRWMIALAVLVAIALAVGISPFYAVLAWGVVAIVGEMISGFSGGWKWANATADDPDEDVFVSHSESSGYRNGYAGWGYYSSSGTKLHN